MAGIRRDYIDTHMLLNGVSATGAGTKFLVDPAESKRTFQGSCSCSSGVATSVSIAVEVTNSTSLGWFTAGTITLTSITGTAISDGFASDASWKFVRGRLVTATTATVSVTLTMGI